MRSPRTTMKSSPRSPQLEKARAQQRRPNAAKNKINKINKFILKKKKQVEGALLHRPLPLQKGRDWTYCTCNDQRDPTWHRNPARSRSHTQDWKGSKQESLGPPASIWHLLPCRTFQHISAVPACSSRTSTGYWMKSFLMVTRREVHSSLLSFCTTTLKGAQSQDRNRAVMTHRT